MAEMGDLGRRSVGAAHSVAASSETRLEELSALLNDHRVAAQLIEEVGTIAHEAWKRDHFAMRGADTPRWKATSDQGYIDSNLQNIGKEGFEWLRLEGDRLEVNIAAIGYSRLPSDWQAENRATGEVVLGLLRSAVERGLDPFSQEFIKTAIDEIHVQWIVRNGQYAEDLQKQSIAEMVGIARTEDDPNQIKAYRNIVMDLNYILAGISTLLKVEFNHEMGLESVSTRVV